MATVNQNDRELMEPTASQGVEADAGSGRKAGRWPWIVALMAGSLVALVLALYVLAVIVVRRPASNEILKIWSSHLKKYKEKTGSYPDRLEVIGLGEEWLDDAWGNRLHYRLSGEGYVLVSFGMDGKSDGTDLDKVRKPGMRYKGCKSYDDDLIVTDINWYRQCAK